MKLEFQNTVCKCLRRNVWQSQQQEQTLEVRLPEGMPDIGNILAAWGQPVLRGKEWRGDGMSVSGGVMAWVLYAPEDGSEPRCIEAWLPYQMKWSFPESQREGTIRTSCLLRGVDARILSARKMMVRAAVSALAEALEPWQTTVSAPEQVPEDVQLLRRVYPVQVPAEAGEKTFLIDEDFSIPGGMCAAEKIICGTVMPKVTEQKVLGGKMVFRGNADLHILYRGEDGKLHSCDFEAPFSQFADLDRDYDKDAQVHLMMAVSSLEPEIVEGNIRLKCGLVAQYLIFERQLLELIEDAYSTARAVDIQREALVLPMLLDDSREQLGGESSLPVQSDRIVDTVFYAEHPTLRRAGGLTELEIPGTFQLLYYDANGKLQGSTAKWSAGLELPAQENTVVMSMVQSTLRPQAILGADQIILKADAVVQTMTAADQGLPMVTGLELGEQNKQETGRPSLILRRAGEESLWEIAKGCGSTMDAIRKANKLQGDPKDDQMLLIPVS